MHAAHFIASRARTPSPALYVIIAVWLFLLAPILVSAEKFDCVLRGGQVIDGSGNPAYFADIGIKGDRIAAIGKITGDTRKELDAHGCVIAPGFIDVHTHGEDIAELPLAENFARMGVTTIVMGNCGSSVLNVGQFFRRLEKNKISINIATLVGHGTVRKKAMGGSFNRAPTTGEMAEMKKLVARAMDDGALGLSTGLIYLPGEFADTDELIELARVAAKYDGIYTSHMRSEGTKIFSALDEVFRISREAGLRAEISHIKLAGKAAWGQADKVLAAIDAARASGLDITQDQYVYTASSTGLGQLIPDEYKEGGKFREHLADAAVKAKMITEMKTSLHDKMFEDYAYVTIAEYKHNRALDGLSVAEAARKVRGSSSLDNQIELLLEIQKNGGASAVFHGMSEADLQKFLQHQNTMIASDSGVRNMGEGVPHPRGYGNNARVLAQYVRELNLLRLEEAVRRMSSLPASVFRLENRGVIREGAYADLTVFDPAKVQDESTFKAPHHYARGFKYVFVNGIVIVKEDAHTGARPGHPLRRQF